MSETEIIIDNTRKVCVQVNIKESESLTSRIVLELSSFFFPAITRSANVCEKKMLFTDLSSKQQPFKLKLKRAGDDVLFCCLLIL